MLPRNNSRALNPFNIFLSCFLGAKSYLILLDGASAVNQTSALEKPADNQRKRPSLMLAQRTAFRQLRVRCFVRRLAENLPAEGTQDALRELRPQKVSGE